jgi:1-acyl-sn-glycerol-3-phosphate acyltransferase
MATLLTVLALLVATVVLGTAVIVAAAIGLGPARGAWFVDAAPRWWAQSLLAAAGVRVILHGHVPSKTSDASIYVSNHVSWFDILAIVKAVHRFSFIAKAELFRVPLFGPAARAVGTIPIERENRKAAFESYRVAGELMRAGRNVIVFPEGTRGSSYALRPFKKGPFVLAIASGAPIVPTVVYGTREVNPRGSFTATPGDVHVHFLEPVPTAGLGYEDRERLARLVWQRMADALAQLYGVASPQLEARPEGTAA